MTDRGLNLPLLIEGRFPDPAVTSEIVVNAPFAEANNFRPGDSFSANLRGQKRSFTIVGAEQSPEFVYTIGPGAMMPDNEAFGIIWMSERAAAAAFDMTGAFNEVALSLATGTNTAPAIDHWTSFWNPSAALVPMIAQITSPTPFWMPNSVS